MAIPSRLIRLMLVAGSGLVLSAQSSTTGALMGFVKDAQGRPVAGARVRISSPVLMGGERLMTSQENGGYRFSALIPGNYSIVVEAQGFQTKKSSLTVELGHVSSANISLQPRETATATVVVEASQISAEPSPVGVSSNVTQDVLETLPSNRDLGSVADLTPGVNASSAFGGANGGAANAYMMDGINVSDPLAGGQYAYANPDWFAEIQVGGIGAAAEYGGFTGAYINGIMQRGGDTVTGTLSTSYSSSNWRAQSAYSHPRWEVRPTPKTQDQDLSLSVGGPLIKSKLWYFMSAESLNSGETPPGATVPIEVKNPRYMLRLAWQVMPEATLEAFLWWTGVYREHRGAGFDYSPLATTQQNSGCPSFGLTWTHSLGSATVLTARLSGFESYDNRQVYNGNTGPVSLSSAYKLPGYDFAYRYYNNGGTIQWNTRDRIAFLATLDHYRTGLILPNDSHVLKMGMEVEQASSTQDFYVPGPTGASYTLTFHPSDATHPTDWWTTNRATTGALQKLRARTNRGVFFLQDNWIVNDRLTIRPGLRYERFEGRAYGQAPLWKTNTLAPRLGLTYALTEDRANLLKFHYGRYFDGLNVSYFDRATPGGGFSPRIRYAWGNSATPYDIHQVGALISHPESQPLGGEIDRKDYYTPIDSKLAHPYLDEFTASYERAVNAHWSVSLTGVYRNSKNMITKVERNTTKDPLNYYQAWNPRTYVDVPGYTRDKPDPTQAMRFWQHLGVSDAVITNEPRAKRSYKAASLAVERRMTDNWSLSFSYTRAESLGNVNRSNGYDNTFENPEAEVNAYGKLPGYHQHEFKFRPVLRFKRLRLSGVFTYLSGERSQDELYVALPGADYIFLEPMGSQKLPPQRNLDLKISVDAYRSKKLKLEIYADIYNALNSSAPLAWRTGVNDDYSNARYFLDYHRATSVQDPRSFRVGARLKF